MTAPIRIHSHNRIADKLLHLNWGLIALIMAVSSIGFVALYSAGAGAFEPWASRQIMRFIPGVIGMLVIALVDIRLWYRLAWPAYFGGLGLLIVVELMGRVGMGAQRWIDLGVIQLQPSELMKIAVIMVLARYYHNTPVDQAKKLRTLILPAIVIALPVALILLQPDLGTSIMLVGAGVSVIFMGGAPLRLFFAGGALAAASIPAAWHFMHAYQKRRVMTFLDPESDPLGAGYHITQSKIALGSGGIEGKGFLKGSQSHLDFLPEKQTDFIFTLWVEEWGLIGGCFLLFLLGVMFLYGVAIALSAKHAFGKYLALGLSVNFSLYVFINIGMVMGLMPVVGAPLPLVSYGGTSMLSALIGFGLMMSCSLYRDSKLKRV
jgi:rod shape determining protein RodA